VSRNQRIGLIVVAVIFAAVAVVIATSGGGDDGGGQAAQTTQTTQTESSENGADTTPTETEAPAPEESAATRIEIRGGEVVGGAADIKVTKGDEVRIVVASDADDDIHLHGYDIEKKVAPGKPARFRFTANVEGIFEIESHVAEDAGRDPLIAKLTVEPG
jgi:plastocyanin